MKQKIILLLLCIFNIFVIDAQVKTKYYHKGNVAPVMSQFIPQKQSSTVTKAMPSFNVDSLKNEDEKKNGLDIPFRFGKDFEVNFSLKDGIWEYNDYGRLWALCVESKGASSLNFIFKDFYLPESAELIIENEDRTVIYGPVTSNTIPKNGVFLTDVIRGDNVKILLFEPFKCMGKSSLTINKVIHGYRDINSYYGTIGSSNPCNIDVACYPEYEKESNAIGLVLLSSGYEWCSGALLMSTDILYKPYFLTAFHCIDMNQDQTLSDTEISDAQDWMFKFMYRKESCNGTDIISGITYNGSIFRAAWNQTDFALVELGQDLPNNENLYWLGWDRSGETPSCGVGIHHPAGDLMKISIEEQSFSKTGWNGNLNQNHWQVNFEDGIYEG